MLIWVGWVEVGGFLVCCLVQFLRVVAFVVSFVGLFAVDLFWLLLLRFTVICCVNSVVMCFFIVLRLWVDVLDLTMLLVIDYECVPVIWLFCWFCVICV